MKWFATQNHAMYAECSISTAQKHPTTPAVSTYISASQGRPLLCWDFQAIHDVNQFLQILALLSEGHLSDEDLIEDLQRRPFLCRGAAWGRPVEGKVLR